MNGGAISTADEDEFGDGEDIDDILPRGKASREEDAEEDRSLGELRRMRRRKRTLQRRQRLLCRTRSPSLPLPSAPPGSLQRPEQDTSAKVVFMSALGLWRVSDENKIGKKKLCHSLTIFLKLFLYAEHEDAWNLVLDDRLSREGATAAPTASSPRERLNSSTEYFVRLRSMRSSSSSSNRDERSNSSSAVAGVGSSERKRACDSAFLDPQLLGTELLSIANYSRAMGAAATSSSSYGLAATLHHFSQQQLQQHQQHLQQQQLQLQQQPQVILHTSSAAPVAIPSASPVSAPTQPAPSPSPSPSLPQPPPTTPSPSATAQQLPILLSTLLPLPRQDAQHVSSSGTPVPVPVPVPVRHHLVLSGGARVPTPPDEEAARRRIPIVAWPGVEALAESYKNYAKGKTIPFPHSRKKTTIFSLSKYHSRLPRGEACARAAPPRASAGDPGAALRGGLPQHEAGKLIQAAALPGREEGQGGGSHEDSHGSGGQVRATRPKLSNDFERFNIVLFRCCNAKDEAAATGVSKPSESAAPAANSPPKSVAAAADSAGVAQAVKTM